MTLFRLGFGCRSTREVTESDAFDSYVRTVLLTPLLDIGVVEPTIESRYEMLPLEDLQRPLLRSTGNDNSGSGAHGKGRGGRRL